MENIDVMSRDYETLVNEDIANFMKAEDLNIYKAIKERYERFKETEEKTFYEFFFLFSFYRKQNMFHEMKDLYDRYIMLFSAVPLIHHVKILHRAKFVHTKGDLNELINDAANIINNNEQYQKHIGFLHHFAELTANYYEMNLDERGDRTLLDMALKYVDVSICGDLDYAKFHLTKGRLLALVGKYDEAEYEIKNAMLKVPNSMNRNYIITEYEIYLNKISLIKASDEVKQNALLADEKLEMISENVRNQKVDNIKTIGLFSSIITFLLGSIEAFKNISNYQIVAKVVTMFGGFALIMMGLILLFSILSIEGKNKKKTSYFLAIICILIGFSLVLLMWFI